MTLTKAQRARLAREARRLAMECVEGTAPEFDEASFCGCAVGEVVARGLGRRPGPKPDEMWDLAERIDELLPEDPNRANWDLGVVSNALIEASLFYLTKHEAVVFPLLALADALEEAGP